MKNFIFKLHEKKAHVSPEKSSIVVRNIWHYYHFEQYMDPKCPCESTQMRYL